MQPLAIRIEALVAKTRNQIFWPLTDTIKEKAKEEFYLSIDIFSLLVGSAGLIFFQLENICDSQFIDTE